MTLKKISYLFVAVLLYIIPRAQVNLQTGSATFSLPMFNWQDDKSSLNSIVALSYNSGNGLKVSDVASSVGQGWNLVSGGVITRMQVGEPDDQKAYNGTGYANTDYNDQDITKYPAGYLFATEAPSKGCPDALRKYPIYPSMNQMYTQHSVTAEDKQLDYFSFQFNGKSGMFVLQKNSANGFVGIPLGDTKMKITFQHDFSMLSQQIRTTITSFTIQDVDGLTYKFAQHGLTKVLQSGFSSGADGGQLMTQPKIENAKLYTQSAFDNGKLTNPWVIGSWYLTEINDSLTQRKIIFTYQTRNINASAGADISYNNSLNKYIIVSYKKSITSTPVIASIIYPDGHNVAFTYVNDRFDLPGDKALAKVDISYKGRYISRYLLNTTYFLKNRYGTPVSDYQKSIARLCLKSVKKIGVDLKEDSPPYIFDYYLGSNAPDDFVPPPFFYEKDIWGYYNGNNSVDYNGNQIPVNTPLSQLNYDQLHGLCFLSQGISDLGLFLNPKNGYAKNGLLKQIVYPTGGSLTYQYAQNTGKLNQAHGSTTTVGGVNVSQTSSADGGYSNGCNTAVVTHYNYILDDGNSSLWGLEMPINHTVQTNNHYAPEWKSWHYSLRNWSLFGECYWHFMYPGILSAQQSVSLSDFQNFMNAAAPYLSILSIVSTISDFATVIGGSTGVGAIVAVIIDIICGIVTVGITCLHDYSKETPNTVYYNFDLNAINPLPAQFKRVEVVENAGTTGKSIQEFTNPDQPDGTGYPLWYPGLDANGDPAPDMAFPSRQRYAPWAYGLPLRTTIVDVNGNKIRQTENTYDYRFSVVDLSNLKFNYPGSIYTNSLSCKCAVVNTTSQRSSDWSSPGFYNDPLSYRTMDVMYDASGNPSTAQDANMQVVQYAMYTGRTELQKTTERVFSTNDPAKYTETQTSYLYNGIGGSGNNYEVSSISTIQSNGDYNYKDIKYSSDFTGAIFDILRQKNIVSLPASTVTYVNSKVLTEKVTEFTQLSNGAIKPSRILEQRFAIPEANPTLYNGTGTNLANYKVIQVFNYDASGNLIGLKDEGGRSISNIYDYDDKYIVASIINADPVTDKADYSSFETDKTGSWAVTQTIPGQLYDNTKSITGNRSLVLGLATLTHSLNTGKSYLLSFWASNSNVSIGGSSATLRKSGPSIGGLTYYEYSIPAGSSSIVLTGNSSIDELRIYPANARMRTTTYDPLIGKTSECDENNRIIYYEYDNLARLRLIKDENRNVVKMYEYNNVSAVKQNGCPGVYYNNLITEIFTKPDCAVGYQGTGVPVTVAANTYTSLISQEDADAQAELWLLKNGPAQAIINGTCAKIYYNSGKTVSVGTTNCPRGYYGGNINYTVPAGRYSSIISQVDANNKEDADILANSIAYANDPVNAINSCTITTDPGWEWVEGSATSCQDVAGVSHLFVIETDLNPNSPTYNQTRLKDQGINDACPTGIIYYNTLQSGVYTRNNCDIGYTGSSVSYSVLANTYASSISVAHANQLATNDVTSNGQNYANINGTCTVPTATCNASNCSGIDKKCILNSCETGIRVCINSEYDQVVGQFLNTYHYEFSDGTWSSSTSEYSFCNCPGSTCL